MYVSEFLEHIHVCSASPALRNHIYICTLIRSINDAKVENLKDNFSERNRRLGIPSKCNLVCYNPECSYPFCVPLADSYALSALVASSELIAILNHIGALSMYFEQLHSKGVKNIENVAYL